MAERLGRNDLCHCGSGKKYKRCHADADAAAAAGARAPAADAAESSAEGVGERYRSLEEALARWILTESPKAGPKGWEKRALTRALGEPVVPADEHGGALVVAWLMWHAEPKPNASVGTFFRKKYGGTLPAPARRWLDAQLEGWMSVFEVTSIRAEVGLELRDVLTGEVRFVQERLGTRYLKPGLLVFARIVCFEGVWFLATVDPQPIGGPVAAAFLEHARAELGPDAGGERIRPEDLRSEETTAALLGLWHDQPALTPDGLPLLVNRDGHEIVFTGDRFDLDPRDRLKVLSRLSRIAGAGKMIEKAPRHSAIEFHHGRGANRRLLGTLDVLEDRVMLAANSVENADVLRARVEKACGKLLRHRERERAEGREIAAAALRTQVERERAEVAAARRAVPPAIDSAPESFDGIYVVRTGPLELADGARPWIYLPVLSDGGVGRPEIGTDDGAALAAIARTAPVGMRLGCAPPLVAAGREHGFVEAPPSAQALEAHASSALSFALPGDATRVIAAQFGQELGRAGRAIYDAAPWLHWGSDQPIDLTLVTPVDTRRWAVSILGELGSILGFAAYSRADFDKVLRAREGVTPSIEGIGMWLEADPAFACEAFDAAFGLPLVPFPFHTRKRKTRVAGETEIFEILAIARAVAALSPDCLRAHGEFVFSDGPRIVAELAAPEPSAD